MRLYLDASVIIDLIEAREPAREQVQQWREHARGTQTGALITSRIPRVECRTRPLRNHDAQLLDLYEAFFAQPLVELIEIHPAVLEQATRLRADYGFKTPDAIHLATAIDAKADRILTGDRDLAKYGEIPVQLLR